MNKRIIAIILMLLAVALLVYWAIDGGRIYTVDQVQVDVVDPLFNTTSKEWKKEFHLGLLPVVAPMAGVLLVASLWLLWSGRSRRSGAATRA